MTDVKWKSNTSRLRIICFFLMSFGIWASMISLPFWLQSRKSRRWIESLFSGNVQRGGGIKMPLIYSIDTDSLHFCLINKKKKTTNIVQREWTNRTDRILWPFSAGRHELPKWLNPISILSVWNVQRFVLIQIFNFNILLLLFFFFQLLVDQLCVCVCVYVGYWKKINK